MSLVSFSMVIGMIGFVPSHANEKTYMAIVDDNGNALLMHNTGFMGPGAADCPKMDSKITNGQIDAMGAFTLLENSDGSYSFYCEAANNNCLEFETDNDEGTVFTWNAVAMKEDGSIETPRNQSKFIAENIDGKYILQSMHVQNRYLYVAEDGFVRGTTDKSQATAFTLQEVTIPQPVDDSCAIKNVATNKYVTFENQAENATIKVTADTVTENEKFNPSYTQNSNHVIEGMEGKTIDTVGFVSKTTELRIGSAKWQDGAVSKIMAISGNGGWESIVVVPNGDGTVTFRSSYTYQYITVDENNELALCDKQEAEDTEKFIIETGNAELAQVTGLKVADYNSTSISLTWDKSTKEIITGYEVWRSETEAGVPEKIADVATNSFIDNELEASHAYYYQVRSVNGQGTINDGDGSNKINGEFSETISATTLEGERPFAPTNIKVEDISNQQVKISWEASETDGVEYEVYVAPSAYGQYTKLDVDPKDTLSCTVSYTKDTKYQYYKVVSKKW